MLAVGIIPYLKVKSQDLYWKYVGWTDLTRTPNEVERLPEKGHEVGGVAADEIHEEAQVQLFPKWQTGQLEKIEFVSPIAQIDSLFSVFDSDD